MRIAISPGTYVVAVSGGVDSMVLLDLLRKRPGLRLIVAHFDHGIRSDSHLDRKHVQKIANNHKLTFIHHEGKLGAKASEAMAREARYEFLEKVRRASDAQAIITAHHQDDVLETAILNLLRGSGRRGLTSLRSTEQIVRPLLGYEKQHLKDYAHEQSIAWREDPSNTDISYTRNYIRSKIMPKMTTGQRAQLAILLQELHGVNDAIDSDVISLLHAQPAKGTITRSWFVQLPHEIAREVVYGWLRNHGVKDISRAVVERLVVAIKTGRPDKRVDVDKHRELVIEKNEVFMRQRSVRQQKQATKKTKPGTRAQRALGHR